MKFKSILTGIAISLFSILLFFAAIEIAVRIVYPGLIPTTKNDWRSRHKGYSLEKSHTTFRIVVLGDSVTFGQGVKRDETFPKKLESLLQRYGGKIKYEVINLGFCGLNTIGEFEILAKWGINPDTGLPDDRYKGLAYNPDLIILEYTMNDASTSGRSIEQIKEFNDMWMTGEVVNKVNYGEYSLPIPVFIDKFLTVNSRSYLFIISRYNRLITRLGFRKEGDSGSLYDSFKDGRPGWERSKGALEMIASIAEGHGIPALLVTYPALFKLDNYPLIDIHQKILRTGNSYGFYTFDLSPAFKGMDDTSLSLPIDGHPNARAHEIAAKAIFEYLVRSGLAPSF